MIRTVVGISLLAFTAVAGFAQNQPLSFEAASLKPTASPGTFDHVMRRMQGGPGSTDPGRFTYENVTVKLLVQMAYNLKDFQVEGPDWIDSLGFDLVATMAPGTTKDQASEMMQTLLKERFKLEFHRETKQMPMFALVVGKNGSKMKESEIAPAVPGEAPPPLPRGGPAMGRGPGIRMMMSPSGLRLAGQMTMAQLANALTRQMQRPVVDNTELPKTYDVDITWMPDNMDGIRMAHGGAPAGGDGAGPDGGPRGSESTMTLPQALDEVLGLKLDARKSPAEVLIIDHVEKAPVEN